MNQENRKKARKFLDDKGYGLGTNYSTGTVTDLMTLFYESQLKKEDLLDIEQIEKEANKAFDYGLKTKPDIYSEYNRTSFVLGYILSAYKELYEKLTL